jgi:hypothetical protein
VSHVALAWCWAAIQFLLDRCVSFDARPRRLDASQIGNGLQVPLALAAFSAYLTVYG